MTTGNTVIAGVAAAVITAAAMPSQHAEMRRQEAPRRRIVEGRCNIELSENFKRNRGKSRHVSLYGSLPKTSDGLPYSAVWLCDHERFDGSKDEMVPKCVLSSNQMQERQDGGYLVWCGFKDVTANIGSYRWKKIRGVL
jgi:hypothetical protein